MLSIKRGDVVLVNFGEHPGVVKSGSRPAIVVQNDVGNRFSPMTIVVPLTDASQYKKLPVQVLISTESVRALHKNSCAECGHIVTVDRALSIDESAGVLLSLPPATLRLISQALKASLAL